MQWYRGGQASLLLFTTHGVGIIFRLALLLVAQWLAAPTRVRLFLTEMTFFSEVSVD